MFSFRDLLGFISLRGVLYTSLAIAITIYWRRAHAKARRKSLGFIEASDRHTLEALPKDGTKSRKICLGVIENGILRISRDRAGAMKVMVVLKMLGGEKKIPRKSFMKALRALQDRHPALRSILRKEPTRDAFYFDEKVDASLREDVPVVWLDRENDESFRNIWERECPNFRMEKHPICLYVLEGDGVSEIVFIMDHFFCDGLSVTNLFREIMTLTVEYEDSETSGKEVDACAIVGPPLKWQLPMEVAVDNSFPNAGVQWFKILKYIFTHLAFEPKMIDFPVTDNSVTADQIFKKCVCNPYRINIAKETVKKVLKVCKENQITMGTAVAVSTFYAIRDMVADTPEASELTDRDLAVPLALDMRRRYSVNMEQEHLGYNISSNKAYKENFAQACKAGNVSKELMLRTAKKMGQHYQDLDYAGVVFGSLLGSFFEQPPTYDHMSSVAITNWGRLNFPPNFGDLQVKELFGVPNNPHFRMPTLVSSTLNGQLTLSVVVTEPVVSADSGVDFLGKMKENLEILSR